MKVLLTALNSKYIHTNLAVRSLQQFAAQRGYRSEIAEYTINQHLPDLIDALYRQRPDVLLLSCYRLPHGGKRRGLLQLRQMREIKKRRTGSNDPVRYFGKSFWEAL